MNQPPSIIVQLVHIHGPMKGVIGEFQEDLISIGRHASCTLRFPADMAVISRKHAEIRREGNQFKLTDFSSNGTFLNGRRVKEAFLKDGDVLEITAGGPKVSFLTRRAETASTCAAERSNRESPPELLEDIPPENGDSPVKPPHPGTGGGDNSRPIADADVNLPPQKTKAPLIIQYGPTIRSFKELPVTIGKNPNCDFVLPHSAILDEHAQILFLGERYWIKDLSGRNLVRLNNRSIETQAPLCADDQFSLSSQGPVFRFLGQGRLAEVAHSPPEESPAGQEEEKTSGKDASDSFWSKWKK